MDDGDESSVLGEGSNAKVVIANHTSPTTRMKSKVAVKVFLPRAGCANIDAEMAKKYSYCKNETDVLLKIEA